MDNIFRSFFGLGHRHEPSIRDPEDYSPVMSPFTSDHDESRTVKETILFSHPDDISRQFDEIFTNFERIFQGLGVIEPPAFEFATPWLEVPTPPPSSSQLSPRDKMLKNPDVTIPYQVDKEQHTDIESVHPKLVKPFGWLWSRQPAPHHKMLEEDSDIDGSVEVDKIGQMFSNQGEFHQDKSVFQSVSVRTHRSADGRIEETRTMVDPRGNKHTVVTRTADDQTIRHTTKISENGETIVTEELINIDEKDRGRFDEKWNRTGSFAESQQSRRLSPESKTFVDSKSDASIYSKLFGFDVPVFR